MRAVTLAIVLLVPLAAACGGLGGISDPGYTTAARNESDRPLLIRSGPTTWHLPAHGAGILFGTIGPPREAPTIAYEIVDEASCRRLAVQQIDFALAPNPGYSEFIVIVQPDLTTRLEMRDTSDPAIHDSLEPAAGCPA
jgi:hypothetical protein